MAAAVAPVAHAEGPVVVTVVGVDMIVVVLVVAMVVVVSQSPDLGGKLIL